MRSLFTGLVFVCAAAVFSSTASAADIPNFNKRGSGEKEEKAFVGEVATTIIQEARTSVGDVTLKEYKFKEEKAGRMSLTFSAGYKGAVTKTAYTADVVVHLDTSDKDKWEVMRIEYKDDNNSLVGFNRKNVDALVNKFNRTK